MCSTLVLTGREYYRQIVYSSDEAGTWKSWWPLIYSCKYFIPHFPLLQVHNNASGVPNTTISKDLQSNNGQCIKHFTKVKSNFTFQRTSPHHPYPFLSFIHLFGKEFSSISSSLSLENMKKTNSSHWWLFVTLSGNNRSVHKMALLILLCVAFLS